MTQGYELFLAQLDDAMVHYPSMHRVSTGGKEVLKGWLAVVDKDGKHWDDYEVEIHASDRFPYEFPTLYEVSDKIPKIADWHIYEDTLSCCVKILPEEIARCRDGITLTEFIREEVMPYLFNQTHRRKEGYYVNGEYSHGPLGVFEYYSGVLGTRNWKEVIFLLEAIAKNERPGRTSLCFCGKNIKFRKCHKEAFDKLIGIGRESLEAHAFMLAKAIKLI